LLKGDSTTELALKRCLGYHGTSKENLHFADQSKQVAFLKGNRKLGFRVSIEF